MRKIHSFIFFAVMILTIIWTAAAGAEDIVIGYTGPLSGPAAEYGQDCVNGLDMAVNEINSRGGVVVKGKRYTFRLEIMDDKVDPKIALTNAQQLRAEKKAIAIFNPVATTIAPLLGINQTKKNEFLVMAYTSIPTFAQMGNKLTVVTAVPFTTYIRVYSTLAWEKGWRKCAMVVTAGAYGEAWRKIFADAWTKKGGTITADKPANYYTRTDFAGPLAEALATEPDFLLIGGPSATTALIIEQARAKGFEGGFMMIDQAKMDAVHAVMRKPLGMEGCTGVAMVSHVPYPATAFFTERYVANYKRNVTWECALHYTHVHVLAEAIAAAGTVDNVTAIRAAIPRAFPMMGDKYPMEIYGVTPNGILIYFPVTQTMKHGKFTKATGYIWWAKTKKEFEAIKKITKGGAELVWFPLN